MNSFERLIEKARAGNYRLMIRFDPEEHGEEWGVKFYPDYDDDAHFYAYNTNLESASRQLLDELESHKW